MKRETRDVFHPVPERKLGERDSLGRALKGGRDPSRESEEEEERGGASYHREF